MTRKHYKLLAEALFNSRPEKTQLHYPILREQWAEDVRQLSIALQSDNPAFDKVRFLAACNVGLNPVPVEKRK